ncbi:HNH endonuclease [Candidatus Bathyarchaeota archaeon]|nr:MAG: HNH endonuclease [Candidatus Bathyarchaeota archaeon]
MSCPNRPFSEKKQTYSTSNLELNKQVAKYQTWNQESIAQRAQTLADQAIKIWPKP